MNDTKNRILRSSGLKSDATRIIRNARATLAGQRITHDNSTTFSCLAAPNTKRTVNTPGGKLTFLSDAAGDEQQQGYSGKAAAAESEARMRRMQQHAMASEEELRAARKRHHVQNGMDADEADELTQCSDEELEAKCADDEELDDEEMDDTDLDEDADLDEEDADEEDADQDAELSRGRVELSRSVGDVRFLIPDGAA